ncbi:dTDP-4-dehydrorhamnose reductase [Ilumatobacter coccineus]|uniref:dTDP-4-dehydrorhamnose reductase n=1 Tax=Ilumatobacter coccineus (strain NBRC 103263 / KCTC 29153 / YM16-304) TaxID=1313172 RepID=A0A6C7E617_ILUCY|nr:dTDP-4-dehydrorhamnose reductase [Ilumatobacter coccineus]BAN03184.1 dTDP-4-dehydrorhamnose reductase [Ilumatobacter coccineus YM16-304]
MRVTVTGAAGQLGSDAVAAFTASGADVTGLARAELDLADADSVEHGIAATRPDVVVNCAAYTAVDACETDVEAAHEVNEYGVRRLAQACADVGAHLIHISTDYVFDGRLDRPYRDDDATNPQSVYGRSKLAGELAARDVLGDAATVVRASWVCGEHGNNMVKLVRRLGAAGNPMAFVDDQRGCPTFTADLAEALVAVAGQRPGGVLHLTNGGAVSWYEFVAEILEASGYDPGLVSPIATDELDPPRPAPRPANSVLDNARWVALGNSPLRHHREPLLELVERL